MQFESVNIKIKCKLLEFGQLNEYLLMCSPGSSSYKQISVCIKSQVIVSGRNVDARLHRVIKQEQAIQIELTAICNFTQIPAGLSRYFSNLKYRYLAQFRRIADKLNV
jgi:hypothetical protein